jgi:antitoxin (DNA-binding transcriptional repressor) of toxin-antitoxin stability system
MAKTTKTNIVGLKELRENMNAFIDRVDKGESFTVIRRSQAVFQLSPVDSEVSGWESVIDFTELDERGVSARDILRSLKTLNG